MTTATVSTTAWTLITTTTADTVFQNKTVNPMYITTESTSGLPFDEGFQLGPGQALVFGTGKAISAVTYHNPGPVLYMIVA